MVATQHTYRTWLKFIANIEISTICNLKCKQLILSNGEDWVMFFNKPGNKKNMRVETYLTFY